MSLNGFINLIFAFLILSSPAVFSQLHSSPIYKPALPLSAGRAPVGLPPQLQLALLAVSLFICCIPSFKYAAFTKSAQRSANVCLLTSDRSILPMPNVPPTINVELEVESGEVENYEVSPEHSSHDVPQIWCTGIRFGKVTLLCRSSGSAEPR